MTYMELNKYNIIDQLHLATQFGLDNVIYKNEEEEFNEVSIEFEEVKDKFSITINGMAFGDYDDKGSAIDIILLSLGSA